jgi:hypothetical protein
MNRLVLFSVLVLSSPTAFACSFAQPIAVEFDKSLALRGEVAPPAPNVTVESISRGGDIPLSSCDDTGVVVLSVPADLETRDLAYSFEVVSGSADDVIFQPVPSTGLEDAGKFFFVFPWVDGTENTQEPLSLVVRVTAFRRSGLAGGSTDVSVVHPGR